MLRHGPWGLETPFLAVLHLRDLKASLGGEIGPDGFVGFPQSLAPS